MSLQGRIKQGQLPSGVKGFTGAAPQEVDGSKLSIIGLNIDVASLSATVYTKATTSTLTLTAKWQVSKDGSTWVDCYAMNNAALVAQVTGTGSAVSATRNLEAPRSVSGMLYARVAVVSGVGVGGGAGTDECSIEYAYRTISPLVG